MFSSKPYKRSKRVSDNIKREIAQIFQFEVNDPRLKSIVVTRVDLSDDLSNAKVYIARYLGNIDLDESFEKALSKSKNYIRKKLASNMNLKKLPRIEFYLEDEVQE